MITHVWYFGGLGQAMIYALVDVWTSLSRMGVPFDPHGKDCVEIPVTIFAGKRQSKSRTNQQAQYVAASLMIPRTCGELFKYTINSFEPFGRDLQKTLVSLYLESCLHGLESAVAAHKTKLPDGTTKEWMESPYLPHPLCGLELPFGNGSFTLIGSPVPKGKFANSSSFTSPTQADLWEGTATKTQLDAWMNKSQICPETFLSTILSYFSRYIWQQSLRILVKISSCTVHGQLIKTQSCALALGSLQRKNKLSALSYILLGANFRDGRSVTVMRDLRADGFVPLFPEGSKDRLSYLWHGLATSLVTTLIELASCDVIHQDIRAGYDESANVLVKELKKGIAQVNPKGFMNWFLLILSHFQSLGNYGQHKMINVT